MRANQKVTVVRLPRQMAQSYCRSCFQNRTSTMTPCCKQPICAACDQRFTQISKCPFTLNSHCNFNYVNQSYTPVPLKPEITVAELAQTIQNASFFIVKSNTEHNVHVAKQYSIWATTHKNFKKLVQAYNNQ